MKAIQLPSSINCKGPTTNRSITCGKGLNAASSNAKYRGSYPLSSQANGVPPNRSTQPTTYEASTVKFRNRKAVIFTPVQDGYSPQPSSISTCRGIRSVGLRSAVSWVLPFHVRSTIHITRLANRLLCTGDTIFGPDINNRALRSLRLTTKFTPQAEMTFGVLA